MKVLCFQVVQTQGDSSDDKPVEWVFLLETKYYNQLVDDLHGMFSLSVSSLLYLKVVQRLFSLFQIIKSKLLQSVFPIFHGLAT
jgi:hypothetical protein